MAFVALCLFAFFVANTASESSFAQEPQNDKPAAAPVNPNPDLPARPTIIFPFDDPKEPLAAERVYLPHSKFVELWNAAHPELKKGVPAPGPGQVTEGLFVVAPKERAKGDDAAIAEVRGRITFFTGKPEWLPIPLKNGVLTEVKLNDQPAATKVLDVNGESRVVVQLPTAGLHVLDLSAELPIQQAGPAGQLTLQLAPMPAGKLLFVNDGEEIAFRVNGATNTFRVRHGAAAKNPQTTPEDAESKPASQQRTEAASLLHRTIHGQGAKETIYEVAIHTGGEVRLAWQPKQAAGAVDAIVQADSATAVQVEDAGVRLESGWLFKVPRGAINDVSFSLPKELKVRSIGGPDVGGWELGENVDGRVLRVFLRRAVSDQTSLAFELFLETRVADEAVSIQVPVFAPLQVSRDFGVVGLFAAPQFALKNIATRGLTQINANQFPVGRPFQADSNAVPTTFAEPSRPGKADLLAAFRYTARPFDISFSAQRRAPESTGFAEHALIVERRKVRMSSRLRWELAGALRSSVSVQLPPMWLPVDVDATALQDWHIDPQTNVLTAEFTEPRLGAVEVVLQGNVPKEPEDAIAEISVPVPLELSKLVTQAAVWFDPAYQATASSFNTWKTSDPEHCSEELRNKLKRPAKFVFTSNALTPEVLAFDLARAVPKLSADAVTLVTVSDTAVDYSLALQWKIADAAADTFTFTTPDWLAGKLDFQGVAIRQTKFESAGEGTGRTRWTVTLQDPVGSRYFLLATATLPPPAEKREVTAPTMTFERMVLAEMGADAQADDGQAASPFATLDTQRQYVVVINISSNQLSPVGEIGETVQRDELPIVVDQRLVDQATAVVRVRGQGSGVEGQQVAAVAPKWSLKSFAAQAGAPASVNLADLTTVLAADGTWRMQCVYTIKNRSRQFLALQLPEKSQALSIFVADQPSRLVALKKDGKMYQLIALPKTSEADLSFPVKLVLSGRLSSGALPRGLRTWSQEIELPTPNVVSLSDDKEYGIPVARTLWAVHVPKDWTAKPLNNPAKNNLTDQASDTVAVAYMTALLQDANEQKRVVEGSNYNSTARLQAKNNLKQLGLALHNYQQQLSRSRQPQSEEGRKLAETLRDFEAKNDDLERRVIIENRDGTTNFYVAKDQQQAARANEEAAKGNPNANADVFFEQLNSNGELFQRQVVDDNNRSLFLGNTFSTGSGRDHNGDGAMNLGDVSSSVLGISPNDSDSGLKFKLNVTAEMDSKPASGKPGTPNARIATRGAQLQGGRGLPGNLKGVTEEDRASRRKQAVEQLDQLNKAVDTEKLAQQQAQQAPNQQPQSQSGDFRNNLSKIFANGSQAAPNAGGLGRFNGNMMGSGSQTGPGGKPVNSKPGVDQSVKDLQDIYNRRSGRYGVAMGGASGELTGQRRGGGFGGGGGGQGGFQAAGAGRVAVQQTVPPFGAIQPGKPATANAPGFSDGLVNTNAVGADFQSLIDLIQEEVGAPSWTQAGGLSLPIEIQREGNVLRFSRASGSPRLSLSVRPNESGRLGLGIAWAAVWVAIAVWLLRVIAGWSSGFPCRQFGGGLSVLGLLGMFFLPSPLSEVCFVTFAIAIIVVSIGVLRESRQNAAA